MKALRFLLTASIVCFLTSCSSLYVHPTAENSVPAFEPKKPIRVALVLGGGGARGLAHLGAIRELEAAGIRPDLIVGCSAGAIIGAFYADDPELTHIENLLLSLRKADLLDTNIFRSRFGVVRGKMLRKFMKRHLHAKTFSELKIPLIVIATDLFTGEVVELSQQKIPIAVRASCAFPGIFQPVLLHNRYLVDGGASAPIPVDIARKYGAEVVIAIDVSEKLSEVKPSHLLGIVRRGLEISYQKFVDQSIAKADIAIKMDFQDVGIFADHMNQELYEHGRTKMLCVIPEIQEKIKQCLENSEQGLICVDTEN